jgi:hypothetical protein
VKTVLRLVTVYLKNNGDAIGQYCGVPDRNISDARAAVCDTIAHAHFKIKPFCTISLYSEAAFKYLSPASPSFTEDPWLPCRPAQCDKSHVRWDAILETGKWFPFQAFPVRGSVRQWCTISIILFTLALNPLLSMLDRHPDSIVWQRDKRFIIGGYAEVSLTLELIRNYEGTKGARLNLRRSKALAVGSWDISVFGMDISYYQDITILGVRFAQTLMKSSTLSWTVTMRKVKQEARYAYHMYLCLKQRIQYTDTFTIARIW